jgi:glycosyltransferase involved in cell wall biosynthesis
MRGLYSALRRRPKIVHARSYLPAAVADAIATLSPGTKMVFDVRGMLGDEYVDAGWWTQDRLEYKLLKRFERRAFHRAEGIVVLTEALRKWMRAERAVPESTPIQVVPCCVDPERFVAEPEDRARARRELGVEEDFVLLYSGSLGGWYQDTEMARFAAKLQALRSDLTWVVLSHTGPERVDAVARAAGVKRVVLRKATPEDMPRLLQAGDVGVSFIRPCFSKKGSSPTKVAEYLAAGMPTVMNAGVGDIDALAVERDACIVVRSYDDEELEEAARAAAEIGARSFAERAAATRRVARARYGIEELGVPRYEELYRTLLSAA